MKIGNKDAAEHHGLQSKIASWKQPANDSSSDINDQSELQMNKPKVESFKLPGKFPDMPCRGLFKIIRHPIYFSFCVILWVSPYLTVDKVVVASLYSLYCFLAPLLKEKRFIKIYGDRFRNYQLQTPYFFPKFDKMFLRILNKSTK